MIFFKLYLSLFKKIKGHGLSKFPLILKINKFLFEKIKTKQVEFFGCKLFLDKHDKYHLSFQEYKIPDIVRNSIQPGQIVIDVGASIGIYTIFFAKMVGEKGKVYAFEPEPKNFELLKKNVEINGFKNIVLENKAVSNITDTIKMEMSDFGCASTVHRTTKNDTFNVPSVTLDDYFKKKSDKIDFIKIDTEGYDGYVILGANETLTRNQHIKVMTEFHIPYMSEAGMEPLIFLKTLQDMKLKIIDLKNDKTVDEAYLKKFDNIKYYSTNFFCEK